MTSPPNVPIEEPRPPRDIDLPPHDPVVVPQELPPAPQSPPAEPGNSTADEMIDRESDSSFPASDPPSNSPLRAGDPDETPEPKTTPREP